MCFLVKLELKNCTNFQSGTALNIRKYCTALQSLILGKLSIWGDSLYFLSSVFRGGSSPLDPPWESHEHKK